MICKMLRLNEEAIQTWVYSGKTYRYALLKNDLIEVEKMVIERHVKPDVVTVASELISRWEEKYILDGSRGMHHRQLRNRDIRTTHDMLDYTQALLNYKNGAFLERLMFIHEKKLCPVVIPATVRRLFMEVWEELGIEATDIELMRVFNERFIERNVNWERIYRYKLGIYKTSQLLSLVRVMMNSVLD